MKRLALFGMICGVLCGCDATGPAAVEEQAAPAETSEQPISLAETSWEWVSLGAPADTLEVAEPARYVLDFQAEGRLAVRADCNRAFGNYEAEAGRMILRIGGMTRTSPGGERISTGHVSAGIPVEPVREGTGGRHHLRDRR